MDLRSGNAYWLLKNGLLASYPALRQDESCDVAIIGGGITGALVAYRLSNEGVDTVLLDKRDIGTGSTAASTSLLQYEIDTELVDLIAEVGESDAVRAYRLGLEAVGQVEEMVRLIGGDCGFDAEEKLLLCQQETPCGETPARVRMPTAVWIRSRVRCGGRSRENVLVRYARGDSFNG